MSHLATHGLLVLPASAIAPSAVLAWIEPSAVVPVLTLWILVAVVALFLISMRAHGPVVLVIAADLMAHRAVEATRSALDAADTVADLHLHAPLVSFDPESSQAHTRGRDFFRTREVAIKFRELITLGLEEPDSTDCVAPA